MNLFRKAIVIVAILATNYQRGHAQTEEIAQLLLNVEKLSQFQRILNDMKKGYDILSGGYKTIKDISEGNFSIHKTFLDALMQVSPTVRNYRKVAETINLQVLIVKEYRNGINRIKTSNLLNPIDINYIIQINENLLNQSLRHLEELALVVTGGQLRMSDYERIEEIDRVHGQMSLRLVQLKQFNSETTLIEHFRAREFNANRVVSTLAGIEK